MKVFVHFLLIAIAVAFPIRSGYASGHLGETFEAVQERGVLRCGVNTGLAGFGIPDSRGHWTGLDVDYCRAISAAVFGDPDRVEYIPLNAQQRFLALQSGEIDALARNTTWTLTRDTSLGLNFTAVTFYDGQGFMVRTGLGVSSALELDGATVCVQPGTTTELNLSDFFRKNNMSFEPVVIESLSEVVGAYLAGRCDVYTTDASGLAATRSSFGFPETHVILPEIISKEPLGPVVRHGDDQWLDIVKWVIFATLEAEERGIDSTNVDSLLSNPEALDPVIQRLLGVSPGMGENLGLSEDWAYNIIKHVGNYAEIFERNVGVNTPIGLERGLNALWTNGGLMYAPPIR